MGWWGEGVMDGDSPLDLQWEFEEEFGGEPSPKTEYTPEKAVDFIKSRLVPWTSQEYILKQVTGWLAVSRGWPINEEFRALIIEGCDDDDSERWIDEKARKLQIDAFKAIVQQYPIEGKSGIELVQTSLFDQIESWISGAKSR